MSHILLPKLTRKSEIKYPHKYADLSVKNLVNDLISVGAQKANLRAIMVGGSKIFDLKDNLIGDLNIESVKKELNSFDIKIEIEIVGGAEGRAILLDTNERAVYVKTTSEKEFNIHEI